VVAFELLPRFGIEMAVAHTDFPEPMSDVHPWYVLFEVAGGNEPGALSPVIANILEQAFEAGLAKDAALAASQGQIDRFWLMREQLTEVQKFEGGSIKHDVSVPVSSVPELISRGLKTISNIMPGCRPLPYGHAGDGNIHFNISQPVGMDKEEFLSHWDELSWPIHEITLDLGGSISAEHGIGQLKRDLMDKVKAPVELDLMQGLKELFDPQNILNPGKLLPQRDD
ncbi:MAG: FAD-binding oxidoreductase, partial [Hyphomicrobiales bacterium]